MCSILYSVAVFSPANALASPCSTWWEKILHAGKFCRWTSIVSMAYCPHFPTLQSNMSEFTLKNYSRIDYIDSLLFLGLCSPPDSSVHGILQARILEWVATPFTRGSYQPRNWTWVSHVAGRVFTIWATREAQIAFYVVFNVRKAFGKLLSFYLQSSLIPASIPASAGWQWVEGSPQVLPALWSWLWAQGHI